MPQSILQGHIKKDVNLKQSHLTSINELSDDNLPHVMWAGVIAAHLIGSYFFDGPVNTTSYAEMLDTWLISQLTEDSWKMCGCSAMEHLYIRVTGLAHVHQHLPCHYPGHHVDLILPFWIALCGQMAVQCHRNSDTLCKAVEQVFTTIKPQMPWHITQNIRLYSESCHMVCQIGVQRLLNHPVL